VGCCRWLGRWLGHAAAAARPLGLLALVPRPRRGPACHARSARCRCQPLPLLAHCRCRARPPASPPARRAALGLPAAAAPAAAC